MLANNESAKDTGHYPGVCFALAMAGCAVKLWNGEWEPAERNISLMQDYSRAANSMYWQNYVDVFRSGLPGVIQSSTVKERKELGHRSHWDPRHWENLSVLRSGYAPTQMLERANTDRCWWCTPEILRLEAERLVAEIGASGKLLAEGLLNRALSVAEEQGARLWRLRTLISIARLGQDTRPSRTVLEGSMLRSVNSLKDSLYQTCVKRFNFSKGDVKDDKPTTQVGQVALPR